MKISFKFASHQKSCKHRVTSESHQIILHSNYKQISDKNIRSNKLDTRGNNEEKWGEMTVNSMYRQSNLDEWSAAAAAAALNKFQTLLFLYLFYYFFLSSRSVLHHSTFKVVEQFHNSIKIASKSYPSVRINKMIK